MIEEFVVVALVCSLFLFHLRSAFVAIVTLPLGVLGAFIVMRCQGVNANIMSLGGIAIAIGAMVDAAVVMIENAHKHIEAWHHAHPDRRLERRRTLASDRRRGRRSRSRAVLLAADHHAVFHSGLHARSAGGRLFAPLAFTKTYAMAVAAGLSVTLIPVLMGLLIRGRIPDETANPLNRFLIAIYRPLLDAVLRDRRRRWSSPRSSRWRRFIRLSRLGGEFLPPLDEGDLLYHADRIAGTVREQGIGPAAADRSV